VPSPSWTSSRDGHEELDHRVEGVDPLLRIGGGVGGAAVVDELELRVAEEQAVRTTHVRGVGHHRHVEALEEARLHEAPLPDPGLLGGAAHHDDLDGLRREHAGQGIRGQQARRSGQVVSARVPDLGQGVHLRQQGHAKRCLRASPVSGEGCRHSRALPFDAKAAGLEIVDVAVAGAVLLEGELRVGRHPAREREGLLGSRIYGPQERCALRLEPGLRRLGHRPLSSDASGWILTGRWIQPKAQPGALPRRSRP
jgi:hypothetical protein